MYNFKKLISEGLRVFLLEHRYMGKEFRKNHADQLRAIIKEHENNCLPVDDLENWVRKLNRLTYAFPDLWEVGEAFASAEIRILKELPLEKQDIVAICVQKNDLVKIKQFVCHHRSLGIDKFIILDNGSTDGSVQWLMDQEDVFLMQTLIPYTTNRREGWINRIMAYAGQRWYLVADSDELLTYEDCEHRSIHELSDYFTGKGVTRARALMVDMYARAPYYTGGNIENYLTECIYMDRDTYHPEERFYMDLICGGPRERVFTQSPWLTKYPFFYLGSDELECKSHFLYPFRKNLHTDCNLVLRHYKFQPGELEKYKKIVEQGNYFGGSRQYKQYLKVLEQNELDFFCENTTAYVNSACLREINEYEPIYWE